MAGKYNIAKITRDYFPWFWQTNLNLALVDVLMSCINYTNDNLKSFEDETSEKVGYSAQRLSLELSLNARFDSILSRIEVTNNKGGNDPFVYNEIETGASEKFVFNEGESLPGGAFETYVFNQVENPALSVVGFTVRAPSDLLGQDKAISSWIDRVNAFGVLYTIEYI